MVAKLFQNKSALIKIIKRRLRLYTVIIILTASIGWLQYSIHFNEDDGSRRVEKLKEEIAILETDIKRRRLINETLIERVLNIKDNPEYIEERARRLFYMISPGEVYIMVPPQKK